MTDEENDIYTGATISLWNIKFIGALYLIESMFPALYYNSIFITTPDVPLKSYEENSSRDVFESTGSNFTIFSSWNYLTFTEEFQLVGEDAWLSNMYQFSSTMGFIVGSVLMGLGDKYGRLKVIRICSVLYLFAFLLVGLSPIYSLIILGRSLMGITLPIMSTSAYTLSIETIPNRYRAWLGFLGSLTYYLFFMLIGVSAYFIRRWRILHLTTGASIYILPFFTLWLDESPRWLIQRQHYEEACKVLKKIQINKDSSNEYLLNHILKNKGNSIDKSSGDNKNCISAVMIQAKQCIHDIFGSRAMCKLSLGLPLLWFLMSIVCYGIPLNANNFTDNTYLYMIIIGAAQIPSVLIGPLVVHRLGNIRSVNLYFILIGVSLLWMVSVSDSFWWLKWILIAISMNMSATMNCLFKLMTGELLPTTLKTTYFGICNIAFYCGFFLASYINDVSSLTFWWLFYVLCAVACSIAAGLVTIFPETHGRKLQETIADVRFHVEVDGLNFKQLQQRRKTV